MAAYDASSASMRGGRPPQSRVACAIPRAVDRGWMAEQLRSKWGLYLRSGKQSWLPALGVLVVGLGMVVLAAGVGLAMMPIMSNALAAVPAESAESASSLNTLTQRVSQSLGLGIVNAFLISAGAQTLADRSGLLGEYASNDPRIVAMQEQGPGGLLAFYQQVTGIAQTHAYSQAFFVIGLICFAGAFFALFLRSGTPAPGSGPAAAH